VGEGARRRVAAVRGRVQGSWVEDLLAHLKLIDFANAVVMLGAALLLSVLPLLILLGAVANERIDDDLSRHIGLNGRGTHIFEGLFRKTPAHSAGPVILGLIIAFAGTMTLVSSLQTIYEQVFEQERRGWRDVPRFVAWILALLGVLIAEGSYDDPLRSAAGPVARALVSFAVTTVFFWWTMHFLLAGRVPWRELLRSAIVTALFWLGFALFSSLYFSSAIISEDKLYGTIGVVFILMTWFIAIGAVVVLGAVVGATWQGRADQGSGSGSGNDRVQAGR
jgi:membrane protein